jgi:hypothetical protein
VSVSPPVTVVVSVSVPVSDPVSALVSLPLLLGAPVSALVSLVPVLGELVSLSFGSTSTQAPDRRTTPRDTNLRHWIVMRLA